MRQTSGVPSVADAAVVLSGRLALIASHKHAIFPRCKESQEDEKSN